MILIIGGRWQGKLDYARRRFDLADGDVFACDERTEALDPSYRCLAYVDRWALNRVRAGADPLEVLRAQAGRLAGAIVISTDISSGVVPVDPQMRAWREACGRMNAWLAGQADEVWRLFCGLPQRLK